MGFQILPISPGPFPNYYDGVLRSALGVLTRSNCSGKNEAKQKNHPPGRLGWYIQIVTWLVLLVEKHRRSLENTKGYKLWLVPSQTLSGLHVLLLDFAQVLVSK